MIESDAPWQFSLQIGPRGGRLRVGKKALCRLVLLHAAVGEKNDVVGQARCLPEIMRGHQHLGAFGADFADDALDLLGGRGAGGGRGPGRDAGTMPGRPPGGPPGRCAARPSAATPAPPPASSPT